MASACKDETWTEEEPLSPTARLFHSPGSDVSVIGKIGFKTRLDPSILKAGFQETFLKHPRFSSKMVGDASKGEEASWVRTQVNIDDHIIVPSLDPNMDSPDDFVEDYISLVAETPFDMTKPLWEFHILNVKTSDAKAVVVAKVHHSMGDGASFMSVVLAYARKSSNPHELPSIPIKKRASPGPKQGSSSWWFLPAIFSKFMYTWNTVVDVFMFMATLVYLKDTKTPIKSVPGCPNNPRRFVHRNISYDDILLVKTSLKMTINDVLLGLTQAALTRYLNRRYGDGDENNQIAKQKPMNNFPKDLLVRASIFVNLRPIPGIQDLSDMLARKSKVKWGNVIGYMLFPFSISLHNDPLEYVRQAKVAIDRKKLSFEASFTSFCTKIMLQLFGGKVAFGITPKMWSNTTLAISNMVGPIEEISLFGYPVAYIAPTVCGFPQPLFIHFQSYDNKMTIALAVDPDAIPDPHQLCDDFEQSLETIKCAIYEGPSNVIIDKKSKM